MFVRPVLLFHSGRVEEVLRKIVLSSGWGGMTLDEEGVNKAFSSGEFGMTLGNPKKLASYYCRTLPGLQEAES